MFESDIDITLEGTVEADIDNLLLSRSSTPKDPVIDVSPDDLPSCANSESPAISFSNPGTYFPYILGAQCWLGGRPECPFPSESDILTAQINTSVHASFIDSALVQSLGISHKVRNRRPPRYATRYQGTPRPRILLPVYFPLDPSSLATVAESQVAKVQIDFVVVKTEDLTANEHQKLTQVEIGSQALFLHGVDVLFSSRTLRIGGLSIPMPQIAPRDQKRLLSSIALAPLQQPSWDRLRRTVAKVDDQEVLPADHWTEDQSLLRDTSTNSSFSSTTYQSTSTVVTSPSMTETETKEENVDGGLPTPPPTAGVFTSALQFIPSSVVAKPKSDESRSKNNTSLNLTRSQSTSSSDPPSKSYPPQSQDNPHDDLLTSPLELSVPSSQTNLAAEHIPSRKSSLVDSPNDEELPNLPAHLLDKAVQRKTSATWPRSLGKKVAPWTSAENTKTSILGQFDADPSPPPRRMKVLKPVRHNKEESHKEQTPPLETPSREEMLKVDFVKDARIEIKEDEHGKKEVAAKNIGGGAFHWMK